MVCISLKTTPDKASATNATADKVAKVATKKATAEKAPAKGSADKAVKDATNEKAVARKVAADTNVADEHERCR